MEMVATTIRVDMRMLLKELMALHWICHNIAQMKLKMPLEMPLVLMIVCIMLDKDMMFHSVLHQMLMHATWQNQH